MGKGMMEKEEIQKQNHWKPKKSSQNRLIQFSIKLLNRKAFFGFLHQWFMRPLIKPTNNFIFTKLQSLLRYKNASSNDNKSKKY